MKWIFDFIFIFGITKYCKNEIEKKLIIIINLLQKMIKCLSKNNNNKCTKF